MGNGAMSPPEDDEITYKGLNQLDPSSKAIEVAWLQRALKSIRCDAYEEVSEMLRKVTRSSSKGGGRNSNASPNYGAVMNRRLTPGPKQSNTKIVVSDAAWSQMLRTAAAYGSICSLELLLQYCLVSVHGAEHANSDTARVGADALRAAAGGAQLEAVDVIVAAFEANFNSPSARSSGRRGAQEILSGTTAVESSTGRLPIHSAAGAADATRSGSFATDSLEKSGRLRRAADCVERLATAAPMSVYATDRNGDTCLHLAARHGNTFACERLLSLGGTEKKRGSSARQKDDSSAALLLVKKNFKNETPADAAAARGHRHVEQLLRAQLNGVSCDKKNSRQAKSGATGVDMERVMSVWEAFFENAARRSMSGEFASLTSMDAGSSSSFLGSMSDRADYYSRSAHNQTREGSRRHKRGGGRYLSGHTSEYQRSIVQSARALSEEYIRYRQEFSSYNTSKRVSSKSASYESTLLSHGAERGARSYNSDVALDAAARAFNAKAHYDTALSSSTMELEQQPWMRCMDHESGSWYWYSTIDGGSSQWDEPIGWANAPWTEYYDEAAQSPYYSNAVSGETSWLSPGPIGTVRRSVGVDATNSKDKVAATLEATAERLGWVKTTADVSNTLLRSEMGTFWHQPYLGLSVWRVEDIPEISRQQDVNFRQRQQHKDAEEKDHAFQNSLAASANASCGEWEECWDENYGRKFWYSTITGESTWEKPPSGQHLSPGLKEAWAIADETDEGTSAADSSSPSFVLAGWEMAWDGISERAYWFHNDTGESLWEAPPVVAKLQARDGWEQCWDPEEERPYWFSAALELSSWECPWRSADQETDMSRTSERSPLSPTPLSIANQELTNKTRRKNEDPDCQGKRSQREASGVGVGAPSWPALASR